MLEWMRRRLPANTRSRISMLRLKPRLVSSRFRQLPDFLILGAHRSGTSSLYRYLSDHPQVTASLRKETEYFTREFSRGEAWYRSHFPLQLRGRVTFEATPNYLVHPPSPKRAHDLVSEAKLVVLLREPASRAWSHYQHGVQLGFEALGFEDALEAEEGRIAADVKAMGEGDSHRPGDFFRYNYKRRGLYADQLQAWFSEFPREQFLILRAEDLIADPQDTFDSITEFLGLAHQRRDSWKNHSYPGSPKRAARTTDEIAPAVRDRLYRYFEKPNEELATLLDADGPLWP